VKRFPTTAGGSKDIGGLSALEETRVVLWVSTTAKVTSGTAVLEPLKGKG